MERKLTETEAKTRIDGPDFRGEKMECHDALIRRKASLSIVLVRVADQRLVSWPCEMASVIVPRRSTSALTERGEKRRGGLLSTWCHVRAEGDHVAELVA